MLAYGYGGAVWLDTPDANFLRSCGEEAKARHMGGFAQLGGRYNAKSNRRVSECSVFKCGEEDSDSGLDDGGGAISTDRDWIKLTSVNFSRCEGRSRRDRMAAIAIAYATDRSDNRPQLTGRYLLILECRQGKAAVGFSKAEPSEISDSKFLNNSVEYVVQTYSKVTITHCTFSEDKNVIKTLQKSFGGYRGDCTGSAIVSDCYFACKQFTETRVSLTKNQWDQSVVPLQDFSAGISYCPALPAQTLTAAETPSLTPEKTPLSTPEETPLSTPEETPLSTPEETPLSTLFATLVASLALTPVASIASSFETSRKFESTPLFSSSSSHRLVPDNPPIQVPRPESVGPAEEQASGTAAIAGGTAGGIAILAVLGVFLLFFLKKKKPEVGEEPLADETVVVPTFEGEENEYISEYGMSDGRGPYSQDELGSDKVLQSGEGDGAGDDLDEISEHNPELPDFGEAPDEL
jgi:hypothetical protein